MSPARVPGGCGHAVAVGLLAALAALFAVPAAAQTTCPQDTVRLTDGRVASEGDVEYCRDNEWRSVCDDDWDRKDADVACRMAGYPLGADGFTIMSTFNTRLPVAFWLDDVECDGTEDSLADCSRSDWGVHNCRLAERAGVRCEEQNDRNLVSNQEQDGAGYNVGLQEFDVAQGFTTGSHATGYRLASIELQFSNVLTPAPTVTLHKGGRNATVLTTLVGPENVPAGNITFRSPSAIWLEPDTTYYVRAEGGFAIAQLIESTGEDSGGLADWTIEDRSHSRLKDTTGAFGSRNGRPWEIQVNGSLAGTAAANATGTPAIAGPAQVGATLEARVGDIADAEGLPPGGGFPDHYALQWIRVETDAAETEIPGATSATYVPVNADENRTLKLRVRFFDGANVLETLTSAATNPVVPDAAPCPAESVWCTVLTSGTRAALGGDPPTVGFRVGAFGSLDDDTFTFGGTTYSVTELTSNGASAINLNTAPLLPVDGGGLTLHVQRRSGNLDLALDAAFGSPHTGASWNWNGVVGTGPSNPVLLRMFRRINERYQQQTDAGTRVTVWLSRQDGVSFEQPEYIAYEGGAGAEVTVTLTPAPTSTTSIQITATGQGGATTDWSGVPSILTFTAGQSSRTFTVTAWSDSVVEDGESVLLEFGTLPSGVPEGYYTTATVRLFDPASTGDARLTDSAGLPTASGEGRLEVFYRGQWGTVCDDRFDSPFAIFNSRGRVDRTVDNHAATFACGLLGYGAGETIDNGAYRLGDSDPTPIWLDDVRCEEGGRHHTGEVPTQLDHCFHAGIGLENCDHSEDVALRCTEPNIQVAEPALRATLRVSSRTHDGTSAFTFRIAFTVAVTISPTAMRDEALTVTGATLTAASPVDARGDLWEIEARPTGTSDVVIEVPIRACSEAGALCTAAGLPLTQGALAQIVYEPPPDDEEEEEEEEEPAPLTAWFTGVPDEHDGASAFTFRLAFSEDIRNGYRRVRDDLLSATGATVIRAGRVNGRSDLWEIEVAPSGHGAVTVTLASGADCASAPCTSDGRTLSAPVTATIEGPPGLSVADAQVEEGPDATLAFPITLDRAATRTVTVEAATADGTATAGEDYRAKTLTKTFAPGETRKVAVIRVLEDAVDDDGETMTLTLSNPSGAYLADAEATGTIGGADAVQNALVDGAAVMLVWPTARDGFGTPSGSDYAVRVNGNARRVVSAQLSGRTGHLELATPVLPGDAVTVAYVGSAMHPLADASGLRSGPWEGLAAVNVTGTEYPLPVTVAPVRHSGDPLASAAAGALRLNASGAGLTDLSGLVHLTALQRLDLSGNALTDLSPLSGLANLRDLDLSDNRIADLWPLSGLHALERLDLSGNALTDLSALSGLTHLRVLVLDGNAVADLGALAHLRRLEHLGLAGSGVTDVTALQDLPALRRLDLGATPVVDVSPLGDVGSLVWLSLPGDTIGASNALGRLTGLRWLWGDPSPGEMPPNGPGVNDER